MRMLKVMIRKIKKLLVNNLIFLLEPFVKKDYKLWFFSMEGGKKFSGNVLYLLEYVKKNLPEIQMICLEDKPYVKTRIEALGSQTCKPNTFKSLFYALRSGVSIFSHEMASDQINISKRDTLKINLWHGLPLKKFQYGSAKIRSRMQNLSLMQKMSYRFAGYVRH